MQERIPQLGDERLVMQGFDQERIYPENAGSARGCTGLRCVLDPKVELVRLNHALLLNVLEMTNSLGKNFASDSIHAVQKVGWAAA